MAPPNGQGVFTTASDAGSKASHEQSARQQAASSAPRFTAETAPRGPQQAPPKTCSGAMRSLTHMPSTFDPCGGVFFSCIADGAFLGAARMHHRLLATQGSLRLHIPFGHIDPHACITC